MKKSSSSLILPLIVVLVVLLLDQGLKFWVKLNMQLTEDIPIFGDWFIIHFIENKGMAFGLELGGNWGKLVLSIFRIIAVTLIGWYMVSLSKKGAPKGLLICCALIFAGAMGNIIDSAFYGLIFSDSNYQLATLFPEEGGYAPFLFGEVVDMLYFELYNGFLPHWLPFWGGDHFIFFRPVFNIADAAITCGVAVILLFYRWYFKD